MAEGGYSAQAQKEREKRKKQDKKAELKFFNKLFTEIGPQMGTHFNAIGLHLGFSDAELKNIQSTDREASEWGTKLLNKFKDEYDEEESGAPVIETLCEALRAAKRVDLAKKVKEADQARGKQDLR